MKHDKEVQKAIDERFGKTLRSDERYGKKTYWDWIKNNPKYEGQEDVRANPDIMGEDKTVFKKRKLEDKRLHALVMNNLDKLTPKERKVLSCLAAGKTMKETGKKLGYTVSAIESFLNKIRKKFDSIKATEVNTIDGDE